MYLIDTSIFLELLLGQKKADESKEFLQMAINGNIQAYLSKFSVYSIEIILEKTKNMDSLEKFLDILMHAKGIKIINTDIQDDKKIIRILRTAELDFDDALHYYICNTLNLKIVSFDKHFDKTGIKRLEPKDVIKRK